MRVCGIPAVVTAMIALPAQTGAAELEVTHWWTDRPGAAAVAELVRAFDATGNNWIDGAMAGPGETARPIVVGRISGGNPMGATQFTAGRQMEELVQAGLMRDLARVAADDHWRDVIRPASLLDRCTIDGKIYCAPVAIHSRQWLWLSHAAFKQAGLDVPKDWNAFVAAAPALRAAGLQPLTLGGPAGEVFDSLLLSVGGKELYLRIYGEKDAAAAAGPDMAKIFTAAAAARDMAVGAVFADWRQASGMVIDGKAAGQIAGDRVQGEFELAGLKAGIDYSCRAGLGLNEYLTIGSEALYFPLLKDEEKSKAQEILAEAVVDPKTQLAFNIKKGSLPVRGDVDLAAANECMRTGAAILAAGNVLAGPEALLSPETQQRKNELMAEFFATSSMSVEAAQRRFSEIIAAAD